MALWYTPDVTPIANAISCSQLCGVYQDLDDGHYFGFLGPPSGTWYIGHAKFIGILPSSDAR